MVEYNEDAQVIWDERPSDEARDMYRPFHARTPFKKVDPRPRSAELFAPFTGEADARARIREARRLIDDNTERRAG